MFVFIMFDRHTPIKPCPVHWIRIRIEDHCVDVPDDNGERSQHRLVPVDRNGNIDPPSRDTRANKDLEPRHESSGAHHEHAPHECPVLRLFGIRESPEHWVILTETEIIRQRISNIRYVFPVWQHVSDQLSSLW